MKIFEQHRNHGGTRGNYWDRALQALLLCFVMGGSALQAQPLSNLVYTVGTAARSGGLDYSYLLIDSATAGLLSGKRFAVWGRPGAMGAGGTFTERGAIYQRYDPTDVATALNQALPLGQNLVALGDTLNLLFRSVPGISNQTVAQKVVSAVQVTRTNSAKAEVFRSLVRANPGLSIALGRAFTEPISGVVTYELREVNLVTGASGDVVGRVTVTNNAPIILPAPGRPFQVVTNHPSDDLSIKLRWGTPDSLRRLSLLNYGFNVWRMPRAVAEAAGYNATPPIVAQLQAQALRINDAPVMATKVFTAGSGPLAADDPTDRITVFTADNNRRFEPGQLPFVDGAQYYYFVTARDVLGRDGFASAGGLGRACKRIPPSAPRDVTVRDEPMVTNLGGGGVTNEQRLRIAWRQIVPTNETVSEYWVYRWPNPTMLETNNLSPLSNRVAVVAFRPGTNFNSYLDNGADAPKVPGLNVYWYSVRAVHQAACDPLPSPHSAPASGVLRQREGPDAPTGEAVGSCGTPVVMANGLTQLTAGDLENTRVHYRFTMTRRDRGIAWVQFFATNNYGNVELLGPVYFAADSDNLEFDYSLNKGPYVIGVGAIAGSTAGRVSRLTGWGLTAPPPDGQRWKVSFTAGLLLSTGVRADDPLLVALSGRVACFNNIAAPQVDPSGTVRLRFSLNGAPLLAIQASTNGGNSWVDVGTAVPEGGGFYSVSYPACRTDSLPLFRGCAIVVPDVGDCTEHIPRAADTEPLAPILLKFRLTPRTREYRLYRQVNSGPLTLISQGASAYDPTAPGKLIVVPDDTMPVIASTLCYYVQVLDEHGNPSPMAMLGCKEPLPPAPPRPVLAEPKPAGTITSPQVVLKWFCPTAGVHRFRVFIRRLDSTPSTPKPSGITSPALAVQRDPISSPVYYQTKFQAALKLSYFNESPFTPTLASGFGPGPQFTLTANVLPNVDYEISVQTVGLRGVTNGPLSEVWPFTWRPPPITNNVPWPARNLPPVTQFDGAGAVEAFPFHRPRVAAVLFRNALGVLADPQYPVGVRIGFLNSFYGLSENVGKSSFAGYGADPNNANPDPNLSVFRSITSDPEQVGKPLTPFVIYRQQVTNAAFPNVSGDIIQVSPLVEKIPWSLLNRQVTIPDRLIALQTENYPETFYAALYVRDAMPVALGARYRYTLVRFKDNREIDQVIPAGEVEVTP